MRRIFQRAGLPPHPRPKRPHKNQLDREVLEELYVRQRIPMYLIAPRLGVGQAIVRREMRRHGIEMRPNGTREVKMYSRLSELAVGESVEFPLRPGESGLRAREGRFGRFYQAARKAGIRVRTRTVDDRTVRVTRVAEDAPRPSKRRLPETEIARLYADPSVPVEEVARQAGLALGSVREIARKAGAERRGGRRRKNREMFVPFGAEELRELRLRRGLKLQEIADRFGVSTTTIRNQLRRHGLQPPGTAPRGRAPERPEIRRLKVGESIDLPLRPAPDRPPTDFYSMARQARFRISKRRIDEHTVRITRIR